MGLLPRIKTAFLSSRNNWCSTITKCFQCSECFSDPVHRTFSTFAYSRTVKYVFQAGSTLNSFRVFLQLNQHHIAHLEDSAARLFTEYHLIFRQVVPYRNLVWSSFYSVDFLRVRFVLQDCVLSNFLYSEINVNVHFRSRLPTVSRGCFHSCGVSLVPSRVPDRLSHFAISFEVLFTTSLLTGCCCSCRPIAFQRNIGSWPWGWESFEQCSIFFLRNHSMSGISWHKIMGDDRKWLLCQNCIPWSCALDNFIQWTASWLRFQ